MYQFSIGQESKVNETYYTKLVLNSEITLLGMNRFILAKWGTALCCLTCVTRGVTGDLSSDPSLYHLRHYRINTIGNQHSLNLWKKISEIWYCFLGVTEIRSQLLAFLLQRRFLSKSFSNHGQGLQLGLLVHFVADMALAGEGHEILRGGVGTLDVFSVFPRPKCSV